MNTGINWSVFDTFPQLETRRLVLRDIRLKDASAIFKMRADKRVNQFIARQEMTENERLG